MYLTIKHIHTMSLQIGDSVIVNDGVKESDESDVDISGWQGRIVKILDDTDDDEIPMIQVEWDSFTLKQMPEGFIAESVAMGLQWKVMDLFQYNVQKTEPRDEAEEVRRVQAEIEQNQQLYLLGDAGVRISTILHGLSVDITDESLERWLEYFRMTVRLPLPVIIEERGEDDRVKIDAIARITEFNSAEDFYGIITTLIYNTKKLHFPLQYLKTLNSNSPYSQLIEDYKVWQGL
jgi:hypothetical protein